MANVIGVRFRNAGKMYWFSPGEYTVKRGDAVIVETSRGKEYGTVAVPPHEVEDGKVSQPLKEIVRPATRIDMEQEMSNREKEREAFFKCREKIRQRGLEMKLILAEYTWDNSKILFYFTADGRVDFRELVRDLAGEFKTRIELRQVGVRDETKMIGGYGICGRDLCCHAYLSDFSPVSIKMAKEQNLSLNPTKISGACGRLMCCLGNEEEVYEEINKRMPGVGDTATAPDGVEGTVISVNVLRETARMVVDIGDDREIREYPASELQFEKTNHRRRKKPKIDLRRNDQKEAKDQAIRNAKAQAIQAAMERQKQEEALTESFGGSSEQGDGDRNHDGKHGGGGRRRGRGRSGGRDGARDGAAPRQNREQNKNRRTDAEQNRNRRDDGGKRREQGEKPPREGEGNGEARRNNRNRNRRKERDNRSRGDRGDAPGNGQGGGQRGGQNHEQGGSAE